MRTSNQTTVPVLFERTGKTVPPWLPIAAATTGVIVASSFVAFSGASFTGAPSDARPLMLNGAGTGGAATPVVFEVLQAVEAGGTVSDLRAISGLTANQIGRLFGVSRRSVQNWVAGMSMAEQHQRRLDGLIDQIRRLGATPEERRQALLKSSGGRSKFAQLAAEVQRDAVIQATALSARQQLGA